MKKRIQQAVSVLCAIFYRSNKSRKQVAELQAALADMQMKALRLQMNPHFIFNSLNAISDYICKNNAAEANRYLIKLARIMRLVLENAEQKEVSLAQDLQVLELYMQLESVRLNHAFTCDIQVDPTIDIHNTMIPPLLLQPFVENSVWHGIARTQRTGKITIGITRQHNTLLCSIEDSGASKHSLLAPHPPTLINHQKPLGMKITRQRIALLGREHDIKTSVQLAYLPTGAKATLTLPLLQEA